MLFRNTVHSDVNKWKVLQLKPSEGRAPILIKLCFYSNSINNKCIRSPAPDEAVKHFQHLICFRLHLPGWPCLLFPFPGPHFKPLAHI